MYIIQEILVGGKLLEHHLDKLLFIHGCLDSQLLSEESKGLFNSCFRLQSHFVSLSVLKILIFTHHHHNVKVFAQTCSSSE